jgi:hypothetical protein
VKWTVLAVGLAVFLAACEKPQNAPTARKADTKAWDAAQNPFVVPGWKSGDQASWESQMRNRAAGQNEYSSAMPRQ